MKKTAKELCFWEREKILINPEGVYEIDVLEDILWSAFLYEMKREDLIEIIHCKRVKDFNPNTPDWDIIGENITFQKLLEIYKERTKSDYKFNPYRGFKY